VRPIQRYPRRFLATSETKALPHPASLPAPKGEQERGESLFRPRCSTRPLSEERLEPTALHLRKPRGCPVLTPEGVRARCPRNLRMESCRGPPTTKGSLSVAPPQPLVQHRSAFPRALANTASRLPRAGSTRATARIRFAPLRSFLLLRVRSRALELPRTHGRSSLGSFAPLKLSPPTPRASNPRSTARASPRTRKERELARSIARARHEP